MRYVAELEGDTSGSRRYAPTTACDRRCVNVARPVHASRPVTGFEAGLPLCVSDGHHVRLSVDETGSLEVAMAGQQDTVRAGLCSALCPDTLSLDQVRGVVRDGPATR